MPPPVRIRRLPLARVLGLLAVLLLASLPAAAQQDAADGRTFTRLVDGWNRGIGTIEQYLRADHHEPARSDAILQQIQKIRGEATDAKQRATQSVEEVRRLLEALGPPPAEGEAAEPPQVRTRRETLNRDASDLRARVQQAELALTRLATLETEVLAKARARLIEEVTAHAAVPFRPEVVLAAIPQIAGHLQALMLAPMAWWQGLPDLFADPLARLQAIGGPVLALLVALVLRAFLLRRFGRDPAEPEPTYARRLASAIAEGIATGIVPAFVLGLFLVRTYTEGFLLGGLMGQIVQAFCWAGIFFVLATALPASVLAPATPQWQLVGLPREKIGPIMRRLRILAAIVTVDMFLTGATDGREIGAETIAVYVLVVSLLEGVALLRLVGDRVWRDEPPADDETDEPPPSAGFDGWTLLRRLCALVAVAAILAAFAGYSALANYLLKSLLLSGVAIGVLVMLRGLLRELIGWFTRLPALRRALALSADGRQRLKFWLRSIVDVLLTMAGAVLVLSLWGLSLQDQLSWIGQAMRGVRIGQVTLSPIDLLLALGFFVLVLVLTRLGQRLLSERVLPGTRIDSGVQNSLTSGLGYIGGGIAIMAAISAVGIDLSSIALIAGALSVGIGFGLQNIVNNFVSGLILLVERPVKVGDWVVVGEHEGFVRRISVRATELQTFQYAAVIIPNADILSSALTNWTFKDRYGRIEVAVRTIYGTDVDRVQAILLEVARGHPRVVRFPEAFALFTDFGQSGLEFELRCFTDDVIWTLVIASDLRTAIANRFAAEGIEVPLPQLVVHRPEA